MNARDTTAIDFLVFLTKLKRDAVRRQPADRWDDTYPEFEREASRADDRYQQEREER